MTPQRRTKKVTQLPIEYKRVSFESGPLTAEKLNTIVQNMDYLRERMTQGHYFVNNHQKENGLIVQGVVTGLNNTDGNYIKYADVYWAAPFTTGCSPIMGSSMYTSTKGAQIFWTAQAVNGGFPLDNRGFRIEASTPEDKGGLLNGNRRQKWPSDLSAQWSFIALGF